MRGKAVRTIEWCLIWLGLSVPFITIVITLMMAIGCSIGSNRIPNIPPTPAPAPTPTPTPTPTPIPTTGGDIATGEWELVPGPRPPALYSNEVNTALVAITGCEVNSRCLLSSSAEYFLGETARELRALGLFAGIQPGADEVCVGVKPYECQGYHVYNSGGPVVAWAPGCVRDTWHARTPTDPGPGPTCPPLTNLKMLVKALNPGSVVIDVTPRGPDCARCASINKGCDAGVCPLGPEGTPEFDAQRIACENAAGPYTFTFNGQPCDADGVPCFHQNTNPLTVKVLAPGLVEVRAPNGVGNQAQVNP